MSFNKFPPPSSSGADPNLTYLTEVDESADLPNSRALLAGTNVTFDDTVPNARTINVASSGGDVVGPAGANDNSIVVFDGPTGLLIRDSLVDITTLVNLVNGLAAAIATIVSKTFYTVTNETADLPSSQQLHIRRTIGLIIGDGTNVITPGVQGYLTVPVTCTIVGVRLLSSDPSVTSGSIVVDIWKDSYANYPPTVGDTITAAAKPTITTAIKSEDTTLTGWTTAITAGQILGFNVDSVTGLKRVNVELTVQE